MYVRLAAAVAASLVAAAVAHAQSLQPLPALPTGASANIKQLSGDGSTLAAINDSTIYRFRNGAWQSLANDWTPFQGEANPYRLRDSGVHLSRDGLVVGATARTTQFDGFFARIYRDGTWRSTQFPSLVYGISADGNRYVGEALFSSNTVPHVGTWNGSSYTVIEGNTSSVFPSEQRFSQGPLQGADDIRRFQGISADGQTAISYSSGVGGGTIVRHGQSPAANVGRPAGQPLPVPGSEEFLSPVAMSGDAGVIVGLFTNNDGATQRPFRWTAATGSIFLNLPALPTADISFDGNMLVLANGNIYYHNIADTLTAAQVLTSGGIDINNWSDLRITQLSDNGQTLAGFGTFNSPPGVITNTPWVATIPTPSMLAMLAVTALVSSRRKRTNV
ncbi:MAG TPA: hypothetical protein VK157_15415 [Phycisphaerales bacterium]|nr:hypothetical protein [Phycisphaerales bacterium]